ncbi:MAG: hypothetical protein IJ744_05535 [Lachnospiraceae bacterium]|nr:hypothetical protein [Lachnospiraceae bacterium]
MKKAMLFLLTAGIVTAILMMIGGGSFGTTAKSNAATKETYVALQKEVPAELLAAYDSAEAEENLEEVKEMFGEKDWYLAMPEAEQEVLNQAAVEAWDYYQELGIH